MINFLDEVLGLDGYSCEDSKLFPIFQTLKFVIRVIQIAVPFALIIWGSLDWFKALIAHDEKEMRIKRKPFISRVIAAILIIVLPWIVEVISRELAGTGEFWKCYSEAKPKINFKGMELDPETGEMKGSSGKSGSGGSGSGGSNNSAIPIKNKCGDFEDKASCEKGQTMTYTCKWVSVQTTYNSYHSYCTNDEKIKLECSKFGAINGKSCPKVDDYGTPCETVKIDGYSKLGCAKKNNPKHCEDYGTNIYRSDSNTCLPEDDYGNKCWWDTTNGVYGDCITRTTD